MGVFDAAFDRDSEFPKEIPGAYLPDVVIQALGEVDTSKEPYENWRRFQLEIIIRVVIARKQDNSFCFTKCSFYRDNTDEEIMCCRFRKTLWTGRIWVLF